MHIQLLLMLIPSLLHASQTITADTTEPIDQQAQIEIRADAQGSTVDLLDELDRKTEDIMTRSKTTAEDISKEAHMPAWKGWVMRAGDFMYWTYQTGADAIQALYGRCKKAITGDDESQETAA